MQRSALVATLASRVDQWALTPPGQPLPEVPPEGPCEIPEWLAAPRVPGAHTIAGRVSGGYAARTPAGGGWMVPATPLPGFGPLSAALDGGLPFDGAPSDWADAARRGGSALLERLPERPAVYRRDALLLLLDAVSPLQLLGALPADDLGMGLLLAAASGTRLEGPLLATAGEWLVGTGQVPLGGALRSSGPIGRAVRTVIEARALSDVASARLFFEARDPWTGRLDLAAPAARELVAEPLVDAVSREDGAAVCLVLQRVHAVGGKEDLGAALDALFAEGVVTVRELRGALRSVGAAERDALRAALGAAHVDALGLATVPAFGGIGAGAEAPWR